MDERKSVKSTNAARDKPMSWIRASSSSMLRGKMAAPHSFFSRHRLRTPSSVCSDPTQCRRHKTVRSMVGLSWFCTRSSIQVQAWPVHQIRPNRGVGLRQVHRQTCRAVSSRAVSRDRGSVVRHRLNPSMTSSRSRLQTHTAARSSRSRLQPNAQVQFPPRQIRPSGSVASTADRTLDLRQILS